MGAAITILVFALAGCGCVTGTAVAHQSGTLVGVHADDFEAGRSSTSWQLRQGSKRTPVLPTSLPALSPEQAAVRVDGETEAGRLVGPVSAAAPEAAPALGGRKLAVIVFNFATAPTDKPWTTADVRQRIFTGASSTSAFFREESYDRLWLTGKSGNTSGDVYGWYTLAGPTAGCPYSTWAAQARAVAAADGFSAANYQHVMYVFPRQSSCSWAGLGHLPGSESWINGDLTVRVTAHELGHNLGLHHAGSLACGAAAISSNCTLNEYGDPWDVMGAYGSRHSHGWHLQRLGLLAPSNVRTITESGVHTFRSGLYASGEPTTLRIPRTRDPSGAVLDWYYLEIRQSGLVFENFNRDDPVVNGVSVRLVDDPSMTTVSRLLDEHPASGGIANAPLLVGETFTDGAISVTPAAAGSGTATVDVRLDGSLPADKMAPSAPSGLSHTIANGGVLLAWRPSSDNIGVSGYTVRRDGLPVATATTTSFIDPAVPSGQHVYTVEAEDGAGNRGAPSAPHIVDVPGSPLVDSAARRPRDTRPPTLRLGRQRLGQAIILRASARDTGGVRSIKLSIDGRKRKARAGARLRFRWNISHVRPGRHRATVRATDKSGNLARLRGSLRVL